MTKIFQQRLIAFFTFIGGLYFFLEFILPKSVAGMEFGKFHDQISTGITAMGVMAIGLGIINLLAVHGSKLLRLKSGWFNSLALLIGLFSALAFEGMEIVGAQTKASERREIEGWAKFASLIAEDLEQSRPEQAQQRLEILSNTVSKKQREVTELSNTTEQNAAFENLRTTLLAVVALRELPQQKEAILKVAEQCSTLARLVHQDNTKTHEASFAKRAAGFLFQSFFVPLGSAMFALLAFYIAAAAYRSFRIRSFEAAVMMASALVVMLGQIPHGPLYISPHLPEWRLWLLQNVSTPAFRAIYFGSAIAGLAMAVRMWLSLEKSPLTSSSGESTSAEGQS